MSADLLAALAGGLLIGVSATGMLFLLGRITGISGIFAGCIKPVPGGSWRYFFLLGLVLGAWLFHLGSGVPVPLPSEAGWPLTIVAGVLVGFGTRFGGGCTSGHGVCGIARLSKRSIVGTAIFMTMGILTVFIMRHVFN